MKKLIIFSIVIFATIFSMAQSSTFDSLAFKKDSVLRAMIHADSVKVEKEYSEKEKMKQLEAKLQYPYINGGKYSGIVPVTNPTEIPNPNQDYKLLFEVVINNPDSMIGQINQSFTEVARVLNLHYASGIPAKRIIPVIVVHGGALDAILNNESFKKKYSIDNPNYQLIKDLEKAGGKFIACGQAMAFWGVTKDQLLPEVKISLTAQTVLSNYQLQGYVLYSMVDNK